MIMSRSQRILTTLLGFAVVAWTVAMVNLAIAAPRAQPVFTGLVSGVAVGGYDPVAYFTVGKPVKGRDDITLQHEGATWRFANVENRDAFKADPQKFAPQYGGYCAWAVAEGYTAKGDPEAWRIADGKLYLNYNKSVQKTWEKDIPANVRRADGNWPKVLAGK
jgi:YHS domain-containing protein